MKEKCRCCRLLRKLDEHGLCSKCTGRADCDHGFLNYVRED